MKICPKCNNEHDKPGTFCSRHCANSRGPRTDEFKQKVSEKLSGRKTSKKKINEYICLNCETEFSSKDKDRLFCSRNCHNAHQKKDKTEKELYYSKCKFKFNTFDYPDYFDNTLYEQYGKYSAANKGNNLTGISRDHAYSVHEGFKNNVSPNIIAHPANCVLMRHNVNNQKNSKCSITLNELLKRIEDF